MTIQTLECGLIWVKYRIYEMIIDLSALADECIAQMRSNQYLQVDDKDKQAFEKQSFMLSYMPNISFYRNVFF